jgi:3'-phosphoadenosine 5'-phosphosulfate (PAPS) 3'-phosphatase
MASSSYQAQLILAKEAAKVAGNIILSYHSTSVGRCNNSAKVNVKSGVDLVTEADTRVEKIVTDMIKEAFPNDLIVGEEDQAESPKGGPGEQFPGGSIWCVGKYSVKSFAKNGRYLKFCHSITVFLVLLHNYVADPIDGTVSDSW